MVLATEKMEMPYKNTQMKKINNILNEVECEGVKIKSQRNVALKSLEELQMEFLTYAKENISSTSNCEPFIATRSNFYVNIEAQGIRMRVCFQIINYANIGKITITSEDSDEKITMPIRFCKKNRHWIINKLTFKYLKCYLRKVTPSMIEGFLCDLFR